MKRYYFHVQREVAVAILSKFVNCNIAQPYQSHREIPESSGDMDFCKVKTQRLKTEDLSRKGSIDKEILSLVNFINDQESYCTTSSCSGRLAIFSEVNHTNISACQPTLS